MSVPKLSAEEKMKEAAKWRKHADALRAQNADERIVTCVCWYASPDAIGYEQGQIRPGRNGQHDMYFNLMEQLSPEELLIATGLSASDVAEEKQREELEDFGIDPDNAMEVARHEQLQSMSPEQLDGHIARLEEIIK